MSSVMGKARKGIATWAPAPDSPKRKEKDRLLWWSDFGFYTGLILTFCGVVLQTLAGILPLRD